MLDQVARLEWWVGLVLESDNDEIMKIWWLVCRVKGDGGSKAKVVVWGDYIKSEGNLLVKGCKGPEDTELTGDRCHHVVASKTDST